jgi:predicted site-specific integrase-resolvase
LSSTDAHGPKLAILYARVSTDEQARSGYSLAQQIEALRDYATREAYEVLEEVSDPGQSGASLERPGMDRVRDLVAAPLWRRQPVKGRRGREGSSSTTSVRHALRPASTPARSRGP